MTYALICLLISIVCFLSSLALTRTINPFIDECLFFFGAWGFFVSVIWLLIVV